MRVWDVSPGYLSRQRLLGEHRELHAVYAILTQGKLGYARHPETLRWSGALGGLVARHAQLVAEMRLRGYTDRTPLAPAVPVHWPRIFVTPPHEQFALLREKYGDGDAGRIPLPRSPQQLWAHHKYSVMARDPAAYRRIGRAVAAMAPRASIAELALSLTLALRAAPEPARLGNALEHMWGHVVDRATADERRAAREGAAALLSTIRVVTLRTRERHLMASTALGELGAYVSVAGLP